MFLNAQQRRAPVPVFPSSSPTLQNSPLQGEGAELSEQAAQSGGSLAVWSPEADCWTSNNNVQGTIFMG